MADLSFNLDLDGARGAKIRRAFALLSNPEPALRDFGEAKRRRIVLGMPRGLAWNERSPVGGPPAVRSPSSFAQRITYTVLGGTQLLVGTYDVRGRILQEGGTIVPKTAGALTVPVHRDAVGKRARDFGNLTLISRKKQGKPSLLVRIHERTRRVAAGAGGTAKTDKRGRTYYQKTEADRWDVMFVLLPSVTIRPRPFLGWDEADAAALLGALARQAKGVG